MDFKLWSVSVEFYSQTIRPLQELKLFESELPQEVALQRIQRADQLLGEFSSQRGKSAASIGMAEAIWIWEEMAERFETALDHHCLRKSAPDLHLTDPGFDELSKIVGMEELDWRLIDWEKFQAKPETFPDFKLFLGAPARTYQGRYGILSPTRAPQWVQKLKSALDAGKITVQKDVYEEFLKVGEVGRPEFCLISGQGIPDMSHWE